MYIDKLMYVCIRATCKKIKFRFSQREKRERERERERETMAAKQGNNNMVRLVHSICFHHYHSFVHVY